MPNETHTPGDWRSECVSDCCRVVVGEGRRKIILARLAPRQLSENESAANGRLMATSKKLLEALKQAECAACGAIHGDEEMYPGQNCAQCREARAAIAEAIGNLVPINRDNRTIACHKCGWSFTVNDIPRQPEYSKDASWFCPHCGCSTCGETVAPGRLLQEAR
jgi:hypothetical protein